MPTFLVPHSEDIPVWFPDFLAQLTNCFEGVSVMDQLESRLNGRFDELRTAFRSELTEVKKVANAAHDLAESNAKAIQTLEQRMTQRVFNLERKCNALKNRHLTEQQEQQETYSRKENLVVRGINEVPNEETEDMCVAAVKQTFTNNLNIDKDYVDRMIIVRCHRLGRKDNVGTYKRPIIVRFMNYNDRKIV